MSKHTFLESDASNQLTQVPEETKGFVFNHTMLRIKDPKDSLAFYTGIFGMTLLAKRSYPGMAFDLYFLARVAQDEQVPDEAEARNVYAFSRRGVLELTHNYGTENDAGFHYHDGNAEPQGFGHICFSVPDLASAVAWFDKNNLNYVKRPEEGKMKHIAFVKDPDGYWIEIVEARRMATL